MGKFKKTQKGKKSSAPSTGGKAKAVRWKKGHSCLVNPSTDKFRKAAKRQKNVFNFGSGTQLTLENLAKHDANYENGSVDMDDESRSFKSFATTVASNCTNVTLGKLLDRNFLSKSIQNAEILAIVGAAADQIHSKGALQTDTEYFAIMKSLLNSKESLETSEKCAVMYLTQALIKRVSTSLLQAKSSELLKAFTNNTEEQCTNQALMKSVIACLTQVLRAQDQHSWKSVLVRETYNKILSATVSTQPKIRKAAHHAVGAILRGSIFMTTDNAPPFHPIANDTSAFCNKILEDVKGGENITSILHILGLLQDVLSSFSKTGIKSTCELILRLFGSPDFLLKSVAMKTLHNMFSMSPNPDNLTTELNRQIINALYEFMPESDAAAMVAWVGVMEKAYLNLKSLDANNLNNVGQLMNVILDMMLAKPPASVYNSFQLVGNLYPSVLKQCLPKLESIHAGDDCSNKEQIQSIFGMAVRTTGPKEVLEMVPLRITGDSESDLDFPRSWLIPILGNNIVEAELGFFIDYFLPLVTKINNTRKTLAEQNKTSRSAAYAVLEQQIWSLLPGFCNKPTDLVKSFPKIAEVLGKVIRAKADAMKDVLAAIRKLINQNLENEAELGVLRRFSKNYIPLFCIMYTKESTSEGKKNEESRLSIFETLKCYLKITEEKIIIDAFEKGWTKIKEVEQELKNKEMEEEDRKSNSKPKDLEKLHETKACLEQWCRFMDLMIAFVPHTPIEKLDELKELLTENLENTDSAIQKKSYRLLESCPGDFIYQQLALLMNKEKRVAVNPCAQAARLKCLSKVILQFDEPQFDFVKSLAFEAALCTKGSSKSTQEAAYDLLVKMGDKYTQWLSESSPSEAIGIYIQLFVCGLDVEKEHVKACSLLALARLVLKFRDIIDGDVLTSVGSSACHLLGHKSNEILKSVFPLVHALIFAHGQTITEQFLKDLAQSLNSIEKTGPVRKQIKDLLRKLLRKCGFERLSSLLKEVHVKVLKNLVKAEKASKKNDVSSDEEEEIKKHTNSIDDVLEETDDDDDDDDERKEKMKPRKSSKVWIKEDAEPLDLMDPSASRKITSSNPKVKSRKEKLDKAFEITEDGRLKIEEKKKQPDSNDLGKKTNKRQRGEDGDDEFCDAMSSVTLSSYQPGGHGIHRPVVKKQKVDSDQEKRKKGKGDPGYAYKYLELAPTNKWNVHANAKKLKEVLHKKKKRQ